MDKISLKNAFIVFFSLIIFCFCPNCIKQAKAEELNNNEIKINARAAYLIDAHTGTEIISKNALDKLPIASMTKLATLSVIFDKLNSGVISLTDTVSVSQNAADTEGSSAFLDAGSKYTVESLIKTIVVVSANDSCVAMAEHIFGSEELFVKQMNNLVSKLNLHNTHFSDCTGLSSENNYSCAKDMATIYQSICNNETYKKFSKIWMEDFVHPGGRITGLVNTNKLIKTYDGCDSGKTGHTNAAKYCLTASASRGGTTLISVIIGAEDSKSRFDQTKDMFNYGFANFITEQIVNTQVPITTIDISGAQQKNVELYADREYFAFKQKGSDSTYKTHIIIGENNKAPIKSGDSLGTLLVLDHNNVVLDEINLVSQQDIDPITFGQILDYIFKQW